MKITKKTTIWILMLMLLAACSQSEVVTTYEQEAVKGKDIPVVFDVYAGEKAQTRSVTTLNTLKDESGFGVFAFYTQNNNNQISSYTSTGGYDHTTYPNFMYNENVHWKTTTAPDGYWTYEPNKYWPNDYTTAENFDGDGAKGSKTSGVSFFAYAPFVEVTDKESDPNVFKTGKTNGIVGFSTNSATGDPKVHYQLGNAGSEDLMWGQEKYKDDADVDRFRPFLNKTKTKDRLKFTFQHALSAFTLYVGATFNEQTPVSGKIADGTYITIKEVKVSATMPFGGKLNLYDGSWEYDAAQTKELFVYNEQIDDHVKYVEDAELENPLDPADPTDTRIVVNPGVGRKARETSGVNKGKALAVDDPTTTYPILPKVEGNDQFIMVMPTPDSYSDEIKLSVTCTYYVWTFDPRVPGGIAKVENIITNDVLDGSTVKDFDFARGNAYKIVMWLGMTSVKLDVKQFTNTDNHEVYFTGPTSNWTIPQ